MNPLHSISYEKRCLPDVVVLQFVNCWSRVEGDLECSACSQVSVIRGKVMSIDGSHLIGVRVSVETQPLYGFTLTRDLGL